MSKEDSASTPVNQSNSGVEGDGNENGHSRITEKLPDVPGKIGAAKEKMMAKKPDDAPAGGYDDTPIPPAKDGYIVKFTFHRAENLPVSDLNSRSSDPYIHATLTSPLPKRHKEDPDLILRTPTVHKSVDPEFNTEWIVAGVPSSGFRLKCRLYDEDPSDHDDRLGNVAIHVDSIGKDWPGIQEQQFDIKKRMASKRAYLIRGCITLFNSDVHMDGRLVISAEVLGMSEKPFGGMYTLGQTSWYKHFSPMIGRLTGTKAPGDSDGADGKTEKYDFQANQFQLQGPVPAELYHRFVEFKPFVKGMFSKAGLRGRVLNKALHHQHARVYNFSNVTEYGIVKPKSEEATLQFLKMAHYDEGGRIFTYVLTLDGLLRFTETGKEFGIDMLSKHTMHSDVNIYIACSGEFFIRRLSQPDKPADAPGQKTHPNTDIPGGPPDAPPPKDPKNYEVVIDNDSGTYRPNGKLLPKLKSFLNENFPGLHIVVKECTDDSLSRMKDEQRERKKKEGQQVEMVQNSDDEISGSDEEALKKKEKGRKKNPRQRVYEAMEDPKKTIKELIPGEDHESTGGQGETSRANGP